MNPSDKRHFRRCLSASDFTLKFRKKYFKAKMINYSPDGIGAVIEDIAPVGKGDVVEIIAEDPEVSTFGEIVWSLIDKSLLRFGVKNVGRMEGLTKDYGLADILIGLQRSNRTGILTVGSGDIVKRIYIRNGDMIFSASNQDEDRLGDILLRKEKINKDQYDQSVIEMKRTGQRQGMIFVRFGYLSPDELVSAVQHQVEHIIESLFALEDGRFAFKEMPLPTEEVITLKLSAANLIYRGIKKINSVSRIQKELPSVDSALNFSANPLDLFQDLRLDEAGKKIMSRIDGKTSIEDIISFTQLGSFEALKTIYALLSIGTVELQNDRAASVEMPEEVVKEIRKEERKIITDAKVKEMIEDMHSKCERLGHYGVLRVKDHASVADIKAAYYKAAKKYHPDMHFHHLADDTLKDKLGDIFSYVYEAYSTLSNPEKRREYDKIMTIKPAKLRAVQDRARAAFEEGKNQLRKNNHLDAERFFGQAAYFDATTADYHYYYGLTLTRLNKFKEAEGAFESARRLEPHNAHYLSELGFVYLALSYPARARGLFEKSLSISPDNVRAAEGLKKIKAD
jgi:curved DNA-binding protein CbpA